jgi:hypothetical protein
VIVKRFGGLIVKLRGFLSGAGIPLRYWLEDAFGGDGQGVVSMGVVGNSVELR